MQRHPVPRLAPHTPIASWPPTDHLAIQAAAPKKAAAKKPAAKKVAKKAAPKKKVAKKAATAKPKAAKKVRACSSYDEL